MLDMNRRGQAAEAILILLAIVVVVGGIAAFLAATWVDTGEVGIMFDQGKISYIADPGFHWRTPFLTSTVYVPTHSLTFSAEASAATNDLQVVNTKVTIQYALDPQPEVIKALYTKLGTNWETVVVAPAAQEAIKSTTAQFTAEQLITRRAEVKQKIEDALARRLLNEHILVQQVSITDFSFSPQFEQSIEQKAKAEQDALTEKNNLAKVQYIAQQRVIDAEANANVTVLAAKAQAESLHIQNEELAKSTQVLALRWIEKWNGQLPQYVTTDKPTVLVTPNIPAMSSVNG